MKHLVLGSGNLGCALMNKFSSEEYGPYIGFKRAMIERIRDTVDDTEDVWIWNTEGFGSVGECANDPMGAWDCHVNRIAKLIHFFPNANIVCFSTNYAVDEIDHTSTKEKCESYYTYTKVMMEHLIRQSSKSNVYAIRVANLYSQYNAKNSFAGRLLSNKDRIQNLPLNELIPTDTDWLAGKLVQNFQSFKNMEGKIGAIAPKGQVSTNRLGSMILNKKLEISEDKYRPFTANLKNTVEVNETWVDVWNKSLGYRKHLGLGLLTEDALT